MGLINKEWLDAYQTKLYAFLKRFQPLLESGVNIKTINNTSILGSGNINIQGGSGNIYKAAVTVGALTSSTWPSGTVDDLNAMRAELQQGYDLVLLPDSNELDVTCVPAVVVEYGSTFRMVFYDGNALYTLTGTPSNTWTITKQEFLVGTTEPATNAIELNNIMLMFDFPMSENDFFTTNNNKHYFYVQPPKSANIDNAAMFADWLVGSSPYHLEVKYNNSTATFTYNGDNTFVINADSDPMLDVTCTKVDDNVYMCEVVAEASSGPSAWESFSIV